mmetsp:Transcript_69464/g.214891  ORF Transcript_69464/g.214891 Transcript_69464/m.214891 type:complete len:128 (+) Transcript_69464:70-453(+)
MGAQESHMSLLQTGPSPHSRPPTSPPYFGHFVTPAAGAARPGAEHIGVPGPWSPSSEVLLGAPPRIDLRPELAAPGGPAPVLPPGDFGGGSGASADVEAPGLPHLGLGPQLGSSIASGGSAAAQIWM